MVYRRAGLACCNEYREEGEEDSEVMEPRDDVMVKGEELEHEGRDRSR